jgi:hypothetical protein
VYERQERGRAIEDIPLGEGITLKIFHFDELGGLWRSYHTNGDGEVHTDVKSWVRAGDGKRAARNQAEQEVKVRVVDVAGVRKWRLVHEDRDTRGYHIIIKLYLDIDTYPELGGPSSPFSPDRIVFEDSLSNITTNWSTRRNSNREFGYKGGEYHITVNEYGHPYWAWAPLNSCPTDFVVKAEMRQSNTSFGEYGVIWGENNENYYMFRLSTDGQYRLRKRANGNWLPDPIDRIPHPTVKPAPNWNDVQVQVRGDSAVLIVNGTVLRELAVTEFGEVRVGFFAVAFGTSIRVECDNFYLLEIR